MVLQFKVISNALDMVLHSWVTEWVLVNARCIGGCQREETCMIVCVCVCV